MPFALKSLKMIIPSILILGSYMTVLAAEPVVTVDLQKNLASFIKSRSDNKGLPPSLLTESKIQQVKKMKNQLQIGGVSDGGGNAVGTTLFDFYENEGANEISVVELLKMEPTAQQMILDLDREIPAVGTLQSPGFGSLLLASVDNKKIYLENKEISSIGCYNQSMVATAKQKIVACQSDTEIRFDAKWLANASAMNRAGLITHELVLGWARAMVANEKAPLEASVRRLIRLLFTVDKSQYPQALQEVFQVRVFSAGGLAKAKSNIPLSLAALASTTRDYPPELQENINAFSDYLKTGADPTECSILLAMMNNTTKIVTLTKSEKLPYLDRNRICLPNTP